QCSQDMPDPTVTQQPNWPVYRGETVTLRCEIQGGGGTQWTYEWRPTNRNSPTSSEYRINRVSESDNGEYSCKAKRGHQLTDWSDAFRLTVRCKCGKEIHSCSVWRICFFFILVVLTIFIAVIALCIKFKVNIFLTKELFPN
uniref:Ig-like domain-containing protein n=1 Tax=Poecilia latipinna TaxID=48699 RepID=A0A3B3U745_9TELE